MNTTPDETTPAKDDQPSAPEGTPSAKGDTKPEDKPTSSTLEVKTGWLRPDVGLPICTSLAAIVFALSSTLGSGSYLEPLSDDWKPFVKVTLFTTTVLFIVVFSVSLYTLMWSLFSSASPPKYSFQALDDAPKKARNVALFFLLTLIVAGASTFIFDSYDPDIAFLVMIVLGILIGASVIIMLLSYAAIDVLKTDVIGFVATIVIFVGSSIVWYNQFRDAEKSAVIADSQYCYWLHSSFASLPDNSKPHTAQQMAYRNDPTCTIQRENGIEHSTLHVTDR